MGIIRDLELRYLKEGDFFVTRLTKRHGVFLKEEFYLEQPTKIKAVIVEIMEQDGVLHRRILHPDVRVDRVGPDAFA